MEKKKIRIADVLPDLLRARKMSARQLSRKAKVPQSTLSSWLQPNSKPSDVTALKAVADELGISLDRLIYGESQPVNVENLESEVLLSGLFKIRLERIKLPKGRKGEE